jgi:hypothetical protein
VLKSWSLNFLEPSGLAQASNEIAYSEAKYLVTERYIVNLFGTGNKVK